MDIFKFVNSFSPTKMERGLIINNLKSKLWIERYRDAGEFKLVAPADSGVRKELSIGTCISHVKTPEIMIVENHEISDNKGQESEVIITGRSFETVLNNRIVGSNKVWPTSAAITEYSIASNYTWAQAASLVNYHILPASLYNDDDALPYVLCNYLMPGGSLGTIVTREIKRGSLYDRLLEILAVDNLGIKVIRPGPWSPLGAAAIETMLAIHRGVDQTSSVIFSYGGGDIESADYFWTNQHLKTGALVRGKWVETVVFNEQIGGFAPKEYARRMIYVEASDIDEDLASPPGVAGGMLAEYAQYMEGRGRQVIKAYNDLALAKAEVSKEAIKYDYRVDYNVGDLVRVTGDYNENATMRVNEFVEIEDENGETGYPTLSLEET